MVEPREPVVVVLELRNNTESLMSSPKSLLVLFGHANPR